MPWISGNTGAFRLLQVDTALQLKIESDNGKAFSESQISEKLERSDLVRELTSDFPERPLALVWRLICLSEIHSSKILTYTQQLIDRVYEKLSTPFGFSLSGDEKMFLPCYNAMIISALCRLGRANDQQVKNAVAWINDFQPIQRGAEVRLPNFSFDRFGGCFKSTPCYIGVAKSVIALHHFQRATNDRTYAEKLQAGINYMLDHRLFKRLSKDEPINKHITNISFPETYHLNAVELIRFAGNAGLLQDERTKDLVDHLKKRRTKDGKWRTNFRYKADGYTVFDRKGTHGEWVTYVISSALNETETS